MNDNFYELKKEKQNTMINGAMEVFARNGYKRASTDEMVKVSGVSKGLWFHYFGNKKGLYDFVVGYGIKYAIMEYENMRTDNMDLFELLKCFERTKIILMDIYPFLPLLIVNILEEKDSEALEIIGSLKENYKDCLIGLMCRVDTSFIDEETLKTVSFMVDSSFRRILKECYSEPVFRHDYYLSECYRILDAIKDFIS